MPKRLRGTQGGGPAKVGVVYRYRRRMNAARTIQKAWKKTRKGRRIPRPLSGTWHGNDKMITSLKWISGGQATCTLANDWFKETLRANSAYRPDPDDTDCIPLGFSQYAALFNRYVVLMSKIQVKIAPQINTDGKAAQLWTLTLSDTDSANVIPVPDTVNNVNQLIGQPGVHFKTGLNADQGGGYLTLSDVYTPRKTLGVPATDQNVTSSVSSSPINLAHFNINAFPTHALDANTYYVTYQFFIEFKIMFYERKVVAATTS